MERKMAFIKEKEVQPSCLECHPKDHSFTSKEGHEVPSR